MMYDILKVRKAAAAGGGTVRQIPICFSIAKKTEEFNHARKVKGCQNGIDSSNHDSGIPFRPDGALPGGDRMAADTAAVSAATEENLPPEQVELTLVDINTAGVEELSTLPGIGEGLAGRIVRYREANGAFESVEALTEVSGIGEKKLEELRDYITVSEGAQP